MYDFDSNRLFRVTYKVKTYCNLRISTWTDIILGCPWILMLNTTYTCSLASLSFSVSRNCIRLSLYSYVYVLSLSLELTPRKEKKNLAHGYFFYLSFSHCFYLSSMSVHYRSERKRKTTPLHEASFLALRLISRLAVLFVCVYVLF